ncbi:M23 family metallopeptidase [Microbacterium stercoris]|uniref:M23 family metallopeptidase n=1 Tax=Microbacterium stercoris TaxID=2820289 RepID=A0A939TR70_9MICO|nr:M23 family metallopeptidase [Microbacterium stercoris]MBO3663841.1 M23 family metallopeptidase [Microbacterium stercoris]
MSENLSSPAASDAETSTGLVKTPTTTGPIRTSQVRSAIRRAEREARRAVAPKFRPVRAIGTVAAVAALIAGVAFPAYAAIQADTETLSVHDVASESAQSMVVASEVEGQTLAGATYGATSKEELEKAKAEKEAAERAKKAAAAAAAAAASAAKRSTGASVASVDPSTIPISAGGFGAPLPGGYRIGDSLGAGHSQATHDGLDLLIASGTPIYAIADGVVATSGWSGGYGLMVRYNSVVDGQSVEVRNAHMSSAAVGAGQTVTRGQVIGYVGSTGASSAPHLHIEIRINGGLANPLYVLPL